MIPEKSNPIWVKLVKEIDKFPFENLATRMMAMRVKLIYSGKGDAGIDEAIEIAYNFFSENSQIDVINQKDIPLLTR